MESDKKNHSHNTKAFTAKKAIITNLELSHQNIPPRKTTRTFHKKNQRIAIIKRKKARALRKFLNTRKRKGSFEFFLGQGSNRDFESECIRSLISVAINLLNFQIHFGSISV